MEEALDLASQSPGSGLPGSSLRREQRMVRVAFAHVRVIIGR